jgi:hypothetical protein
MYKTFENAFNYMYEVDWLVYISFGGISTLIRQTVCRVRELACYTNEDENYGSGSLAAGRAFHPGHVISEVLEKYTPAV